jgi:hypothetical protein
MNIGPTNVNKNEPGEQSVCSKCGGRGGWLGGNPETMEQVLSDDLGMGWIDCECQKVKNVLRIMPPRLAAIPKEKILPAHLSIALRRIIPAMQAHLMVVGPTALFELVMKCLYNGMGVKKIPERFIRWTTDSELTHIAVGGASAKHHLGASQATYEDLSDGFISNPDILIMELGKQLMKNRMGAQALEETIRYRLDNRKPIWLMSCAEAPWQSGCVSWSESNQALADKLEPLNLVHEFNAYDPGMTVHDVRFTKSEQLTSIDGKFPLGSRSKKAVPKETPASQTSPDFHPMSPREFSTDFKRKVKPTSGFENYGKGVAPNKLK